MPPLRGIILEVCITEAVVFPTQCNTAFPLGINDLWYIRACVDADHRGDDSGIAQR